MIEAQHTYGPQRSGKLRILQIPSLPNDGRCRLSEFEGLRASGWHNCELQIGLAELLATCRDEFATDRSSEPVDKERLPLVCAFLYA